MKAFERKDVTRVEVNEMENDNYDPRDPAYITPASNEQIEEINIAMLEQQIRCLQHAIFHRENDGERQILGHYKCVLFSLQSSLQIALQHKGQAGMVCDSEVDMPSGHCSKRVISKVPQQPVTCFHHSACSWFEDSFMTFNV